MTAAAEVTHLQAAYCNAIDHAEAEAFIALFTPDGVLSVGGNVIASGMHELAEFAGASRRGVHVCGPALLLDDGTARTSFVFHAHEAGGMVSGYYTDTFTRGDDGVLRFRQRDIEIAIRWPNEDA